MRSLHTPPTPLPLLSGPPSRKTAAPAPKRRNIIDPRPPNPTQPPVPVKPFCLPSFYSRPLNPPRPPQPTPSPLPLPPNHPALSSHTPPLAPPLHPRQPAPPPAPKRARKEPKLTQEQRWHKVFHIAAHLGIIESLAEARNAGRGPDDKCNKLVEEAVEEAHYSKQPDKTLNAFKKFATFCADFDIIRPFLPVIGNGTSGGRARRHNQHTLDGFQRWLARTHDTSKLSANSIADYASAIKRFCEVESGGAVTDAQPINDISKGQLRRRKQNAPPASPRALCIGVGGSHLDTVWDALGLSNAPLDCPDLIDFDAACTCYECTLRGCEACLADNSPTPFNASRDLSVGCVVHKTPSVDSSFHPWCCVDVYGKKDANASHQHCPTAAICRCSMQGKAVPNCGYCAIMRILKRRFPGYTVNADGRVADYNARCQPLLVVGATKQPYQTSDVAVLAKRFARLAGLDADFAGAKSFRIKSATDLLAKFGLASRDYLKRRGRWFSDIFFIYARVTWAEQCLVSAALGADVGDTVERPHGYVQPARR